MGSIASQITSLTIVYSDADQSKHQRSASLAVVRGIHRGPVNSPHKWPVTRKCFHLMTSLCGGGKHPSTSGFGIFAPSRNSWWVNCAIPTAHVVLLYINIHAPGFVRFCYVGLYQKLLKIHLVHLSVSFTVDSGALYRVLMPDIITWIMWIKPVKIWP